VLESGHIDLLEGYCDEGDGAACYALGASYLKGIGVTSDLPGARDYFASACRLRFALGCSLVGDLYYYGVAVTADTAVAMGYYHRACLQAFAPSCLRLETLYRSPDGSTEAGGLAAANLLRADWYRREACAIGRLDACAR
jgi:TPR repeat protein